MCYYFISQNAMCLQEKYVCTMGIYLTARGTILIQLQRKGSVGGLAHSSMHILYVCGMYVLLPVVLFPATIDKKLAQFVKYHQSIPSIKNQFSRPAYTPLNTHIHVVDFLRNNRRLKPTIFRPVREVTHQFYQTNGPSLGAGYNHPLCHLPHAVDGGVSVLWIRPRPVSPIINEYL